jgi:hypothetical protein
LAGFILYAGTAVESAIVMIPQPIMATAAIINMIIGTGFCTAVDQVRKNNIAIHDITSKILAIKPYSLGAVQL